MDRSSVSAPGAPLTNCWARSRNASWSAGEYQRNLLISSSSRGVKIALFIASLSLRKMARPFPAVLTVQSCASWRLAGVELARNLRFFGTISVAAEGIPPTP
jgi:hypothetical protein